MHRQSALPGASGSTAETRTPYGSTGSAQTQNASTASSQPTSLAPLLIDHAGPGSLEFLEPEKLRYDLTYGRFPDVHRLAMLRTNWDTSKAGMIYVSQRADESMWVIDGHHRVIMAMEKSVSTLPAYVFQGLSINQEAALYAAFGDAKRQTRLQVFRAREVAGDKLALSIHQTIRDAGFDISFGSGAQHERMLHSVVLLESLYVRFGQMHLFKVLRLIRDMFPKEPKATRDYVINATSTVLVHYPKEELVIDEMIERVREQGFLLIASQGHAIAHTRNKPEWWAFGQALVDCYNGENTPGPSRRKHRLAEWDDRVPRRTLSPTGRAAIREIRSRPSLNRKAGRHAAFTADEIAGAPD